MGTELLGDRNVFAVELALVAVNPSLGPYGGIRFWVRGHPLGDLEDHAFYRLVTPVRDELCRARLYPGADLSSLDDTAACETLIARDDQLQLRFYCGEGFDRFESFVISERRLARIVWRERTWEGDYEGQRAYGGRVTFEECDRVLDLLDARIEDLDPRRDRRATC